MPDKSLYLFCSDGDNEDDFAPDLSNYNMLAAGEIAAANGLVTAALFQVGRNLF